MHLALSRLMELPRRGRACRLYPRRTPDGDAPRRVPLFTSPMDPRARGRAVEQGLRVAADAVTVALGQMQTCGYWHSCLICGAKIALHKAAVLEHVFTVWTVSTGGSVVMPTFTSRHSLAHPLEMLILSQREAWSAKSGVRSGRPWARDRAALGGAEWVIPCRELTVGDRFGYHFHSHNPILCREKVTQEQAEVALAPTWERWRDVLSRIDPGLTPVGTVWNWNEGRPESAGFDIKVMEMSGEHSAAGVALYPFKAALEAVGGVFKNGREMPGDRHRTLFEIREYVATFLGEGMWESPHCQRDVAIVAEAAHTMIKVRPRQMYLDHRLVKWAREEARRLGIPGPLLADDPEKSDEAIAEAAPDVLDRIADVCPTEFRNVVAWELDVLRAMGRAEGVAGVRRFYEQRGLVFDAPRVGAPDVVPSLDIEGEV